MQPERDGVSEDDDPNHPSHPGDGQIASPIATGVDAHPLAVETEATDGAIVFRKGRVLASVDDGAPRWKPSFACCADRRDEVIRRRIAASLDRFARAGGETSASSPRRNRPA